MLALLLLPALALASVCPGNNSMLEMVTSMAESCFEECPQLCAPVGAVADEYLASADMDKMKRMVCTAQQSFDCMFGQGLDACQSLLSQGQQFGIELPTSNTSMTEQCEALANGHADILAENGSSDAAPTDAPTHAPISQAAGSCAWSGLGIFLAVIVAPVFSCSSS